MVSLFEEHRQEIAEIIAREMGLPATQADGAACWTLDHMRWRQPLERRARKPTTPLTKRLGQTQADGFADPTTLDAAGPEIGVG